LLRDKTLDSSTVDLIHFRYGETLLSLGQRDSAAKEFATVTNRAAADAELKTLSRQRLEQIRKR